MITQEQLKEILLYDQETGIFTWLKKISKKVLVGKQAGCDRGTGVYHHTSAKHLGRYVNEFAFRLNDGNVKRHTLARLDSFVDATARKRLTYAELIA